MAPLVSSGKTTFERLVQDLVKCCASRSTIDPIKEIAYDFGWNGEKDLKGRKLLANLKQSWVEYGDQPYEWLAKELAKIFDYNKDCVVFIDCREPEEIAEICKRFKAKSLLIRRAIAENTETSNESDRNVLNYDYDIIIENNGSMSELALAAEEFVKNEELPKTEIPYYIDLFGEIVTANKPEYISSNQIVDDITKSFEY